MKKLGYFLIPLLLVIVVSFQNLCYSDTVPIGHNVAILVGMNVYDPNSDISNLRYAERDMSELKKVLDENGYETVFLDSALATKENISSYISQLARKYPAGNNIIFAFSGHGFSAKGVNYLAVRGTGLSNLTKSGVAVRDVISELSKSGFTKKMLFIDACRNKVDEQKLIAAKNIGETPINDFSPNSKDLVPVGMERKANKNQGVKILYSTDSEDYSFEDESLGHGVFSYFLIKKMKEAKNGVFFHDLLISVSKDVQAWVYEKHNKRRQVPFQEGPSTGEFLIIPPKVKPPPPPERESKVSDAQRVASHVDYQRAKRFLGKGNINEACQIFSRLKSIRQDAKKRFNESCN